MPACMPVGDAGTSLVGETTTATGGGRLSDTSSSASEYLFEVENRIVIDNVKCASAYGDIITPGQLCIDTTDQGGICNGDDGGPLNLNVEGNKYTQVGIASFVASIGCESGVPHAYTRVSEYIDFIETNAGKVYQ